MTRMLVFWIVCCSFWVVIPCYAVLVDGYCFLENQTNHVGTSVFFQADSLGAVTDSAFTDASGYYQIDLTPGSYGVFFSHEGFVDAVILGQHFFAPANLPDITLLEPPPGIQISGNINGTLEDTTYVVEGEVVINVGDSLLVEPSATIYFIGRYDIEVYGYLSAVGTETDSIYFLSASNDLYWGSIIFRTGSSPESQLSYCHITGAGASAVNCYYTDVTISNCTLTGNRANWGAGIYCSSANALISDCLVMDNVCVNNGGGIYCTHCNPTIINCTVTGNSSNQFGGGSGRGGGGICANHSSNPIIESCIINDNYTAHNGGGISINDNSHAQLIDCLISANLSDSSGGGVFVCQLSNVTVTGCEITDNTALTSGGIYLKNNNILTIDHCVISGNAASHNGGGIGCISSNPSIANCTIHGNDVDLGGGIFIENSRPEIVNTIIAENAGIGGVYFGDSTEVNLTYCDVFSNAGGNFAGSIPPDLGVLSTVNLNGDSCDVFFNLYLDPLFVDPTGGDYHLLIDSPCIDAGDPASPYDPDGTIADIGAFYYDQGAPAPVVISLTPINPPITIPASGGSFDFIIQLDNVSASPATFEAWIMVQLPNSQWFGPVLGPVSLMLPAGASIDRQRIQNVPANAPLGIYVYESRVGTYPNDIWDADSFTFEKLASGGALEVGGWANSGQKLCYQQADRLSKIPDDFGLICAYPNPFNPTTTLRFNLVEATKVHLAVYDVSGSKVATLVHGYRTAGSHEVTFDGTDLVSGIYIYHFMDREISTSGKLLLLK